MPLTKGEGGEGGVYDEEVGWRRKTRKGDEIKTIRQDRKDKRFLSATFLGPGADHLYLIFR